MTIPELQNSKYHSTLGPIPIGYAPYRNVIIEKLSETARELGYQQIDYNGEYQTGTNYAQLRTANGQSWSSSKVFLNPIRDRDNLFIFKNTLVTKILIADKPEKRETGVICVTNNEAYKVYASKEVIVTSGAINTPKLLLLSGVGPKNDLEQLGIQTHADLPVGVHLSDNPSFVLNHQAEGEDFNIDLKELASEIDDYVMNGRGILTAPRKQRVVFASPSYSGPSVPPSLLPDFFYNAGYLVSSLDEVEGSISVIGRYLTPASTGTVKLISSDYRDAPLIDPNYLSSDTDDFTHLMITLKYSFDYYKSPSWENLNLVLENPSPCNYNGEVTKEFATCFLKYNGGSGSEISSTARMGPAGDKKAVVDPQLKVYGINGLRIADASIIPKPVRARQGATVIMIAEKASDLIKADHECALP